MAVRLWTGFEIRIERDFVSLESLELEEDFAFPTTLTALAAMTLGGQLGVHCGPYRAHGPLILSTGEIWQLYTELLRAHTDSDG